MKILLKAEDMFVELLGCRQRAAQWIQEARKFKIKKMAIINTANEGAATTVYWDN